jgi:hypothetical protein
MIKVSEALQEIIKKNQTVQFGLSQELFNLSQLSKYLVPLVKARTKKEVQPSAILMALSRLQRKETRKQAQPRFEIKKLSTNSGLVVATFNKTKSLHRSVNDFYGKIQDLGSSLTISEGTTQVTVIYDSEFIPLRKKIIKETPFQEITDIGSLSVRFDQAYLQTPGFIYLVLQQLYFQNINVVELSSTATEMIIFLSEDHVQLAFDTLYSRFRKSA